MPPARDMTTDGRGSRAHRVGILGHGAIGSTVARLLEEGAVPGCRLAGVFTRSGSAPRRLDTVAALAAHSDIIVEAAGHAALEEHGPEIVGSGTDLLVVSAGALIDDALYEALRPRTGGRLLVSTGAIGGLDLLRAARLLGPLEEVLLESTKTPAVLRQPWMEEKTLRALDGARGPVDAFQGSAREAAARFPESANVAAALALATVGLDATRVVIVADPDVNGPRHVVRASGAAGSYEVTVSNRPSEQNPRTSAITAYAVARALGDRGGHVVGV
ncbi:MAG: aspartate dehydrogenase [Actinobacteria bacterium]|nr:aspartate dehydrogenase [Actinomycetota bacterium]